MGTDEMTAAEAALEAARLGLIGTIAVGVLAALTTLAGTLLAPFMIRRSEKKAANALRRREELVEIVPAVIVDSVRGSGPDATADQRAAGLAVQAKLGVLLRSDEWEIGAIAKDAFLIRNGTDAELKAVAIAATLLPMWARDEITSAQAASMYTRDTGRAVRRPVP